ncbi:MAG: RNA polymerase sigma factor (sigma-70 family) [Crocinitomicaceae bacterium]|jgi:RNA polymerase sigma factor (sigma-70 family)
MTDLEIIHSLRKGQRENVIRFLYKELPKIEALLLKSGCDVILANEIFNDSLILFIEKVESPDFVSTSNLTTFLYGINRFLVMRAIRDSRKRKHLEWNNTLIVSEEDLNYDFEKEEKLQKIESILNVITEKCKKIFQLFYFNKNSMESIAKELGFSSVNSAKTQKYKCLQKAHQLAQEIPNPITH